MVNFEETEFQKINNLIEKRILNEALVEIKKCEKKPSKEEEYYLQLKLLYCRYLIAMGEFTNAKTVVNDLIQELKNKNNLHLMIEAKIEQILVYLLLSEYDECSKLIYSTEILLNSLNDDYSNKLQYKANVKLSKGIIYRYRGYLEESQKLLEDSSKLFEIIGDRKRKANALLIIGQIFLHKSDFSTSIKYFQDCLKIYTEIGYKSHTISTLNRLGDLYYQKGDMDRALEYFEDSMKICNETDEKLKIAETSQNMAILYNKKGELKKALDLLQKAEKILEIIGNKLQLSRVYTNLGINHLQKGDLKKTLHYFNKKLEISKESGSVADIALAQSNIGYIYSEIGKLDSALEFLKKSLKIYEKIEDSISIARTQHNIANIYASKGKIAESLEFFEKSLEIRFSLGNKYDISNTLFRLIDLNIEINDPARAKYFLTLLKDITKEENQKLLKIRYRLAYATVNAYTTDKELINESYKIFKQFSSDESIDFNLLIFSKIKAGMILFEKFTFSGDKEVLRELYEVLTSLEQILKNKSFYKLYLMTTFLKGKLNFIEMYLDEAEVLFKETLNNALNSGFHTIVKLCKEEIESIKMLRIPKISENKFNTQKLGKKLINEQIEATRSYMTWLKLQSNFSDAKI